MMSRAWGLAEKCISASIRAWCPEAHSFSCSCSDAEITQVVFLLLHNDAKAAAARKGQDSVVILLLHSWSLSRKLIKKLLDTMQPDSRGQSRNLW